MKNMQVDLKEAIKEDSIAIMNAMRKDGIVSSSVYFNELSASLIYLNYSNPHFRERNDISKWNKIRSLSNIDTNLNIISVYEMDGSLCINAENAPSEKKLNDFKIVTLEPNIYGTLIIQHKMKNLIQKIKKDEQMLWKSYQIYGLGVIK